MQKTRLILAMILTYMIFAVLLNSVGTLILQSARAFAVGKEAVSVLDAFKDLPIAIVSFLAASSIPRLGYRRAMMLGLAIVAVAAAAMPLIDRFWSVKLMLAATGAAFALVKVSVYSSIALVTDSRKAHASLTSIIEGWFMVGVLLGPWLFGLFIGMQREPSDPVWLRVYWCVALAALATMALLWTVDVDVDESAAATAETPRHPLMQMLGLMALPLVGVFLLTAFLSVLVEQGIGTWLPTFYSDILHLPTVTSVQMASLFAGAIAAGRLLAGLALRHVPWHWMLIACIACMAALLLLVLPLSSGLIPSQESGWRNAPAAAFLMPLIGFFMAPIYPAINSVVLSALPKHLHAAMTGLIVVFSALGGTVGSYLTGLAFAKLGGQTAFYLSLVPLGLLAASMLVLQRRAAQAASSQAMPAPG